MSVKIEKRREEERRGPRTEPQVCQHLPGDRGRGRDSKGGREGAASNNRGKLEECSIQKGKRMFQEG